MDPLKPRARLEKDEERDLKKLLKAEGWLVEKTHGSLYMKGWPDLYLMHPKFGTRWVEVKRPGKGLLEKTQVEKFTEWRRFGVHVWILTGPQDYALLFKAPNWHFWLDPSLRKLHGLGR